MRENNAGYVSVAEGIDADALTALIDRHVAKPYWQFLRWPHQVKLKEPGKAINFSCTEGQVFNPSSELRWQRRGKVYDALLLSLRNDSDGLTPLGETWTAADRSAHFYPKTETRFPKGLDYDETGLDIGQRYFIDDSTACVQFIALRVES
ncbi:MAG: hypothetical protein F6J97_22020 [Leptolyngbya sp. SIO4C1]|nr:hypothetical protein [Leptolyngbya sp. SIO4C1]